MASEAAQAMAHGQRLACALVRWCRNYSLLVALCQFLPAVAQQPTFEPTPEDLATLSVSASNLPAPLRALGERLFEKTVFDGDWYSHALHLGLRINGQNGTVTISNSPNMKAGNRALALMHIERGARPLPVYLGQTNSAGPQIKLPWFDGFHFHVDGTSFPVQGRLTPSGELLLMPRSGLSPQYTWKMQRVNDPAQAARETCAGSTGAFDGVWYSAELRYGIQVCNGRSRFTLPPREPWVQRPLEPLKIASQSGSVFEGSFAQTNARAVNVRGTRTRDGQMHLELVGRTGTVTWAAGGGQNPLPRTPPQPAIVYGSTQISCPDYSRPSSGTANSTSPVGPSVPFGPYAESERSIVRSYGLTGGELRIAGRELVEGTTAATRQRYRLAHVAAPYAALSQAVYTLARQVDTAMSRKLLNA
jgi:hypothetical protein